MTELQKNIVVGSFCTVLVLLAASLVLALFNLGTQIVSFWLLLLVQCAVGVIALAFTCFVVGTLCNWVMDEIKKLHRKHEELLKKIEKRTPLFVVLTLLTAQCVLAVTGNVFGDKEVAIAVTVVLTVLFALANEFIIRDKVYLQIIGVVLWILAVIGLPFFIWADRGFDVSKVLLELNAYTIIYKFVFAGSGVVFLLLLLLFIPHRKA